MSDGGSGVKQFTNEMKGAAADVAKEVTDQVGQMVEQGVQSVTGTTLTPQQIQQKEIERQKKLAETRRKLVYWKQIEEEQKAVRQKQGQQQLQQNQQEIQQKQIKQFEKQKRKQPLPEEVRARAQSETKAGRGVGG